MRRVSAPFAENPLIFNANVSLSRTGENRYFVSSEGARLLTGQTSSRIFIQAMTRASDGMDLPLYASYFARTPDGLPTEDQLLADVRQMMGLLDELREAPIVDPYSGPAIPPAARPASSSTRSLGTASKVTGRRTRTMRRRSRGGSASKSCRRFLGVMFDPTLTELGGTQLNGHYLYDDEGVKGRPVVVVENGILKTFLHESIAPAECFSVQRARPCPIRVSSPCPANPTCW